MKTGFLILGDQLFPVEQYLDTHSFDHVFMIEDRGLCTHFKYHKQKIVLFLSAMRHHAEKVRVSHKLSYVPITEQTNIEFEDKLKKLLVANSISSLKCFEIEDTFFRNRIIEFCKKFSIKLEILQSPMFLCSHERFRDYLSTVKKPFLKTFYERERKHLRILITKMNTPIGGQWSFDAENRSRLPEDLEIVAHTSFPQDSITKEVTNTVSNLFSDHPGEIDSLMFPVDREQALVTLSHFIELKLKSFGDFQDAISPNSDFVFHSGLSTAINMGLVTPHEVVSAVISSFEKKSLPLNSVEGFIRQLIGWREFVRGIYNNFDHEQQSKNFFKHSNSLSDSWYLAKTGIPPLDDCIKKTTRIAYLHHIERLMIVSNIMLLCEIHPQNVYRWFMEMIADSSDWVMGPNVFGMGQFSDGGIFATKPYICGSNYILKMSRGYSKGNWCNILDGLYWRFIEKNRSYFASQPRLSMMVRTLDKMNTSRKQEIFKLAENFIIQNTRNETNVNG